MRIDKQHITNILLALIFVVLAGLYIRTVSQPPDSVALQGLQERKVTLAAGDPLPITGTTTITTTDDIPVTLGGEVIDVDATGQGDLPMVPFAAIAETGVTELIGVDEQASQYDYSEGTEIALGGSYSGEVLNVTLILSGTLTEAGTLLVFDADPSVTLADANLATASWPLIIGGYDVAAGDWFEENAAGTGATATFMGPTAFHALSSLWVAYYHEGATQWNSLAADNESLSIQIEYRRDS